MVMQNFRIQSRCECQALLVASLDDKHDVVEGHARRKDVSESAPAHTIGPRHDRFDVGWLCPFCGRNTLRTFHVGALKPIAAT
jgi:hypothetical protein